MSDKDHGPSLPDILYNSNRSLLPDFITAVENVVTGRKKVEQNTTDPDYIRRAIEDFPSYYHDAILYHYIEKALRATEGKQQVHASWQTINTLLGEALGIDQSITDKSPEQISMGLQSVLPEDPYERLKSRSFLISIALQQRKDDEITEERAVDLTYQFQKDSQQDFPIHNPRYFGKLSMKEKEALFSFQLQSFQVATQGKTNRKADSSRQLSLYNLELLSTFNAQYFHNELLREQNERLQAEKARTFWETLLQSTKQIKNTADNSGTELLPSTYVTAATTTLKTLGRSVQIAHNHDMITTEEYLETAYSIIAAGWSLIIKKATKQQDFMSGEQQFDVLTQGAHTLAGMRHVSPWIGVEKNFWEDITEYASRTIDRFEGMMIYGYAGSLNQMYLLPAEVCKAVWEKIPPYSSTTSSRALTKQ